MISAMVASTVVLDMEYSCAWYEGNQHNISSTVVLDK